MFYLLIQGNIVIDIRGQALLCDFGLSRIRHGITRTYTCIRTGGRSLFIPPELSYQAEPRSNECGDIYTFTMAILKLGTGANPFKGEYRNDFEAVAMAHNGWRPRKPFLTLGGLRYALFDGLWAFMERMWAHDPARRPIASEVVGMTGRLTTAALISGFT